MSLGPGNRSIRLWIPFAEAAKGSRGSDPRLLRPNNGLATRPHIGERPRASRIVHALGLDQPSITQYHRSTRPRIEAA
jgi:hypothetical protein